MPTTRTNWKRRCLDLQTAFAVMQQRLAEFERLAKGNADDLREYDGLLEGMIAIASGKMEIGGIKIDPKDKAAIVEATKVNRQKLRLRVIGRYES